MRIGSYEFWWHRWWGWSLLRYDPEKSDWGRIFHWSLELGWLAIEKRRRL